MITINFLPISLRHHEPIHAIVYKMTAYRTNHQIRSRLCKMDYFNAITCASSGSFIGPTINSLIGIIDNAATKGYTRNQQIRVDFLGLGAVIIDRHDMDAADNEVHPTVVHVRW